MMAGMITLLLTGLLRGVRTQRFLVLENLALRHQLAVLQRTTPRPSRHRDPMAAVRLQALLDLEELPERTRPPGRRPGGPSAHSTDVHGQPPLGRAADPRGRASRQI